MSNNFAIGLLLIGGAILTMGDVLMKSLRSHTVPKYLVNAWESPWTLGGEKLFKPRIEYEPYKGFVQSTIENKGEE